MHLRMQVFVYTDTDTPACHLPMFFAASVGRYSSLARPNNNHAHCLHQRQRPTDDSYSSTTWPIHIPSSSSAHRAVRPLLRTRTSCPLHRPAAACSSVRHKVCGQCAKDQGTRQRDLPKHYSKAAHPCRSIQHAPQHLLRAVPISSRTRPSHSRITSPAAPLYLAYLPLADSPPIRQ